MVYSITLAGWGEVGRTGKYETAQFPLTYPSISITTIDDRTVIASHFPHNKQASERQTRHKNLQFSKTVFPREKRLSDIYLVSTGTGF